MDGPCNTGRCKTGMGARSGTRDGPAEAVVVKPTVSPTESSIAERKILYVVVIIGVIFSLIMSDGLVSSAFAMISCGGQTCRSPRGHESAIDKIRRRFRPSSIGVISSLIMSGGLVSSAFAMISCGGSVPGSARLAAHRVECDGDHTLVDFSPSGQRCLTSNLVIA
jgi:hypothetical protein